MGDTDKSLSPQQDAERTMVELAVDGDAAAFGALYDMYMTKVYKKVFYHVKSHTLAEDITQETFVKAWKAIRRFQITGAPFPSWLFTIARNLLMDHYKLHKKDILALDAMKNEYPASVEPSPEQLLYQQFDKNLVREAVLKLKGDKQKVILMHLDGFSYKEVAETLHKTEGAIRVIQSRALQDLIGIMTGYSRMVVSRE